MAEDETSPLKVQSTDEQNMGTMHSLSPHYSPQTSPEQTTLKIQLLQLLKSTNIEEDDLTQSWITPPVYDTTVNIKYELNSDYNKHILWEELDLIQKLHGWIEQKGKPAITKVHDLQMKCDTYEQKLSNATFEIQTLHSEIDKMTKEKSDLQSKYSDERRFKNELAQTIQTIQIHQNEQSIKYETIDTNNNDLNEKINELKALNKYNNSLKSELINITKLNVSYMEQNSSLKTMIGSKDLSINELTKDRNEWENNATAFQNDLLERLSDINQLRKELMSYKSQIEVLRPNSTKSFGAHNTFAEQLNNGKTIRVLDNGASSADLSFGDGNAFLPDKSLGINGIYTQQSMGSVLTQTHNRGNSRDLDTIMALDKKLKDERSAHQKEMEVLTGQLEEMKQKLEGEYGSEIKGLQSEIHRLKAANGQSDKGCNGCDGCVVM